jgi:hypothetical protein
MYRITIQISLSIHVAAKNIKGGNTKWLQTFSNLLRSSYIYYTNYTNSTQKGIQYDSKILQKRKETIYYVLNQSFILENLKYVILVS